MGKQEGQNHFIIKVRAVAGINSCHIRKSYNMHLPIGLHPCLCQVFPRCAIHVDGHWYLMDVVNKLIRVWQFSLIFSGYLIVAPRKVRPDQVYRVDVTVYQMYSPKIVVRASLSRDNDQYAFQERVFTEASTKNIEIQVRNPISWNFVNLYTLYDFIYISDTKTWYWIGVSNINSVCQLFKMQSNSQRGAGDTQRLELKVKFSCKVISIGILL